MPFAVPLRTRLVLVITLLGVLAAMFGAPPHRSVAAPVDDEGGTASLRKKLEAASKGWTSARTKLQNSQRQQKVLAAQAVQTEKRLVVLRADAQRLGAAAYRGGLPGPAEAVVDAQSMPDLMDRMAILDNLSGHNRKTLRELRATEQKLTKQKKQVDAAVITQRKLERTLAKRKSDAESALSEVGGGRSAGFFSGSSVTARPAPRNSDGSWPSESCSVDDPTTSGCLTPRTLHAYQQARAAGFTHYTACMRDASSGEHGKGRACDFAAAPGGFEGAATGSDKLYGDRLAAYFVDNADRLAVLYVIWYRQIWLPGQGWQHYDPSGAPSTEHTNHVHLSVQ